MTLLVRYLRPLWGQVVLLTVLLLGGLGLQLAQPQVMRVFLDTALRRGSLEVLTEIALVYLGTALVGQALAVLESYAAENLAWAATNRLRVDLVAHCLGLDMPFHNARTPGELIERVDGDVAQLSNFFARFSIQLLGSALLFAGILVLLFGVHWEVGAAGLGFAVLSVVTMLAARGRATWRWAAERQANAELFGFLEERLAGLEDIRTSGATSWVMRRSFQLARALLRRRLAAGLVGALTGNGTTVLFAVGTAGSLAVAGRLFLAGQVSLGSVVLVFTYVQMLEQPVSLVIRQIQDLQQAAAGLGRIRELLALRSGVEDGGGRLPPGPLAVAFRGVAFAYEQRGEDVLRDVSFELRAGCVLGLVGRTGSGKSTLTRLLFRLYDPDSGSVELGGRDLRSLRLADVRASVAVVPQEVQLFHASVRDNLTLFDSSVGDERIAEVLDGLGLGEWRRALPEGLATLLSPGGVGLSAGEAQLLAFARVFLRDPGLVVLDEASSRLDPSTQRRVERAVDRLLEGRTAIVIAHRLTTIERADEIIVMEGGRIVEHGLRAALAGDPLSRFAGMLRTGLEESLSA